MENLKPIWKSLSKEGKQSMAISLDTSVAYLSQIANGAKPGKHFKKLLEVEIDRQLRLLNKIGQVSPSFNGANREQREAS